MLGSKQAHRRILLSDRRIDVYTDAPSRRPTNHQAPVAHAAVFPAERASSPMCVADRANENFRFVRGRLLFSKRDYSPSSRAVLDR